MTKLPVTVVPKDPSVSTTVWRHRHHRHRHRGARPRLLVLEPRIEVALPLCAGGSASASAGAATATASAAASGRLGRQRRASRSRLERLRVWVEGRVICGLGRAHNDAYHGGAVLHERRGLQLYPASSALQAMMQASSNEQIKHMIRKLHAVFVQPQQPQDKSLGGDVEHQMIFARPLDHFPDFDRPVVRSRHDLGPIGRKRHRPNAVLMGFRLLAHQHQLQRICRTSQQASVLAKEGRF